MDIELLRQRAGVFRKIREFFDSRNYLEVDTPLLAPDLIPESCLEVFETRRIAPAGPGSAPRSRSYWLVPSPEIWMKKLIAKDRRSIYQIGKCFRNGESSGFLHSPEFTMLEYYTMDAGYLDSLGITEELFAALAEAGMSREYLRPPFMRITMGEAFERWAGFDLYGAAETGGLEEAARRLGLDPPEGLGTAALYDLIFIHAVEPHLPRDRPVAVMDYPAFVPCLAQRGRDGRTAERWELYVRGIELANCYSEETDAEKVRAYFEEEGKIKQARALVPHHIDRDYWKIFLSGLRGRPFPRCSGAALGLDRLIMVLAGRSTIDGTLSFPMEEL
ncbi:MAG: LysR family transcriptional regulator [Spirochaetaceae bacterium]|jgi:lysyl-tRNA synthetase class 2|nr:LysR family transcriptional regulator [Spirochaetaceae bacterium]